MTGWDQDLLLHLFTSVIIHQLSSRAAVSTAVRGDELCAGLPAPFIDTPRLGWLPALRQQPEYTMISVN